MYNSFINGINLGAVIISAASLLILAVSICVNEDRRKLENKFFLAMCLTQIAVIVLDAWVENLTHSAIDIHFYKALVVASYVPIMFFSAMHSFYTAAMLRSKAYVNMSEIGYVVSFVSAVMMSLWVLSILFDTNMFVVISPDISWDLGYMYALAALAPILMYIFDVMLVFSFGKLMARRDFVPWIIYLAIPAVGVGLAFFYGTMCVYNAVSVSMVLFYSLEHAVLEKNMAITEKELADSKMKLLISQIQPHFMYNALNSIYYLIDQDPETAQEAVSSFSDYLRQNVNTLKSDKPISFKEELGHTESYIYLEKLRFEDKLNIVMNIEVEDFLIPPLTLQPIVENAIKHGVSQKETGGTVIIGSSEDKYHYYVTVSDDGVGFDTALKSDAGGEHTHVGIKNVDSRLQSMCSGSLKVDSTPGEGTVAVISLPKEVQSSLLKEV